MIIDDAALHDKEERSAYATIPRATAVHGARNASRPDVKPPFDGSLEPLLGWRKPVQNRRWRLILYMLLLTLSVVSFVLCTAVFQRQVTVKHPVPKVPDHDDDGTSTSPSVSDPPRTLPPAPTSPPNTPSPPPAEDTGLPPAPGVCISSKSWRHHGNGNVASMMTHFPMDADTLRFDSLGSLAEGSISFTTGSPRSENTIQVEIIAYHREPTILDRAVVCLQQGTIDNIHGAIVLTNTSRTTDQYNPVRYDIRISFPGPGLAIPRRPRYYGHLKTNLPFFRHEVHLPTDQIRFQSVSLRSHMARISVPSLSADSIDVATSEYPVDGFFDISSSIGLSTTGASIDASILMLSNKDGIASASLNTVDGSMYAIIDCRSWHPMHAGSFAISSSTTNSTSTTILKNLPIGAALTLDASTTGTLRAELPLSFEGAFRVSSLNPQVTYNPLAVDPAGGQRKRVMTLLETSSVVEGIIRWTQFLGLPKTTPKGTVNLRTTEGRALLHL